ncbi:MAG: hypothetical protein O2897_04770 [bacterium]|nr:hypothetical protein [bacterium]
MQKLFLLLLLTCCVQTSWALKDFDPKLFTVEGNIVLYKKSFLFHANREALPTFSQLIEDALINNAKITSKTGFFTLLNIFNTKKQIEDMFSIKLTLLQRRLKAKSKSIEVKIAKDIINDEDLTEEIWSEESLDDLFTNGVIKE